MNPILCLSILFILCSSGAEAAGGSWSEASVAAVSLMQKGLRSMKTDVNTESRSVVSENEFSDDDESCSADGLSPGVCALAGLARSSASSSCIDCQQSQSNRLERALISEIEAALGGRHADLTESRLKGYEDEIWPLYVTLPKEAHASGGLGLSAARYLLHQFFLRKHRWYVRGLNPAGDSRKDESIEEALRGHVAGQLLELLEKEVGKSGLGLRVMAVFVATLEHLIHGDERERFKQAWKVHELKPETIPDDSTLTSVLEVYMGHYIFTSQEDRNGYALTLKKARDEIKALESSYDGWSDIKGFIKDAVNKLGKSGNLNTSMTAADEVLENFNKVSAALCVDLTKHLTTLPEGITGKVPLSHLRIASGMEFFRESTTYLRDLGALDETDPSKPRVLLPNYIHGPSNCDGTTSFYDLCCPNECEQRLQQFELLVASNPDKDSASLIAEVIEFESELSEEQKQQLRELVHRKSDHAFLHGRPFAQFLHETFPGECPRPRTEDFSSEIGDSVPDAHMSFQKAALLETWTMTPEEARREVQMYTAQENGDLKNAQPFRLASNLRGGQA
eukprot:TRINITY_DN10923_c0_g1_i1.p1 TRINITY_DN10923_c0_g1~~TRINITY_DN10923_c0_g1_i1.p1  ORF type:complete len:565 (+),score=126.83 TRINITY_DN10923_c0_g1_i1:105-1799(+)